MPLKHQLGAFAALVCLTFTGVGAFADNHAYTEGAVVSVSSIRTADGKSLAAFGGAIRRQRVHVRLHPLLVFVGPLRAGLLAGFALRPRDGLVVSRFCGFARTALQLEGES